MYEILPKRNQFLIEKKHNIVLSSNRRKVDRLAKLCLNHTHQDRVRWSGFRKFFECLIKNHIGVVFDEHLAGGEAPSYCKIRRVLL